MSTLTTEQMTDKLNELVSTARWARDKFNTARDAVADADELNTFAVAELITNGALVKALASYYTNIIKLREEGVADEEVFAEVLTQAERNNGFSSVPNSTSATQNLTDELVRQNRLQVLLFLLDASDNRDPQWGRTY